MLVKFRSQCQVWHQLFREWEIHICRKFDHAMHAVLAHAVWTRYLLSHPTPWEDHKCFRIYRGYQANESGSGRKEGALSQTLNTDASASWFMKNKMVVLHIFTWVNWADLFFFTRTDITYITCVNVLPSDCLNPFPTHPKKNMTLFWLTWSGIETLKTMILYCNSKVLTTRTKSSLFSRYAVKFHQQRLLGNNIKFHQ